MTDMQNIAREWADGQRKAAPAAVAIHEDPAGRWLVLSEDHYRVRHRHKSADDARAEAIRLAGTVAPGKKFYVLHLVAVVDTAGGDTADD